MRIISEDNIQILIDLAGYTTYSRPEICALQPAPIQCSYLGYPDTMGADFIDYLITDNWIVPPELAAYYSETVIRLPHQFVVSPLEIDQKPVKRAELGLPEQGFVFCCFNNHRKITPEVFTVWMKILKRLPDSVLWLSAGLEEMICHSVAAYEERAVYLATHPQELAAMGQQLQENQPQLPLFNLQQFVENLEAAYGQMWREYEKKSSATRSAEGKIPWDGENW